MSNIPTCNILLLGKTGVGKSSLLNYLLGENLAETGSGRPITQSESGFVGPYEKTIGSQQISITDSVGLEVEKALDWLKKLSKLLEEHNVTVSIEHWYHMIIYCINSAGHRVEDIDCNIIANCIESRSSVVVVFTNADCIGDEEIEKLTSSLKNGLRERNVPESVMPIICSCNSSPKSRIPQFGKEEILSAIQQAWKETVVMRLPVSILRGLKKCIDEWKNEEINKVEKNLHCFGEANNDMVDSVKNDCEHFENELFTSLYPQIAYNELQKAAQFSDMIQTAFIINEIPAMKIKLEKKKLCFMEGVGRVFALLTAGIGFGIWAAVSKVLEKNRFNDEVNQFAATLKQECDNKEEQIFNDIKNILNVSRIEFIPYQKKEQHPFRPLIQFLHIKEQIEKNPVKCNILLLGKTGVGKSSLLNYLLGENLAETGSGRPITQSESGFVGPYEGAINDQQVSITDSVGLEADKSEDWFNNFNKLLIQHDVTAPYHVVIYCLNSASFRIQDIDYDIIIKCIENSLSVVVVFTKADFITDEEIEKLTRPLKNCWRERNVPENSMPIICSCNSSPKSRCPQFGKEEILSAIQQAMTATLLRKENLKDYKI